MKPQAHYNPKSVKWLISLVVMLVLSAAVIAGSIVISNVVAEKNSKPVEVDFQIASTSALPVEENELNITGIEKAVDSQGNVVAYVVKGTTEGYNKEVPIEFSATITADGKVITEMDILHQEETEYLGVRVAADEFKNQFKGRKLPLKGGASVTKGSSIDLIAKSTISSQAVVDGVNNACTYVQTFLAE